MTSRSAPVISSGSLTPASGWYGFSKTAARAASSLQTGVARPGGMYA